MIQDSEAKANISANLKRLLGEAGISQRELARQTGDPIMTINDVVNGRNMPGAGLIARIAEALDVSTDAVLSGSKKKSRNSA